VRTARLVDGDSVIYSERLPELLDVHLTAMSPQAFTLTGFERVAGVECEEIVALCEKRLTAFLRDFLAKQPGVKHVPAITVSYAPPATPGAHVQ
jgi:hypothetical protein